MLSSSPDLEGCADIFCLGGRSPNCSRHVTHASDGNRKDTKGVLMPVGELSPLLTCLVHGVSLMHRGCRVDHKDADGWTALHRAAVMGSKEVLRILVENNADVNVQDKWRYEAVRILQRRDVHHHTRVANR